MGLVSTPFFHIECNGPAATPWGDHCTTQVKGSWDEAEVELRAHEDGWALDGRKWLCPQHVPAPAPAATPARQRRGKNEAPPSLEDGHQ